MQLKRLFKFSCFPVFFKANSILTDLKLTRRIRWKVNLIIVVYYITNTSEILRGEQA